MLRVILTQRNRIVRHVYNVNPLRPNPLPVPDLTLASGSYDNTIRLWNPDKGYCEKLLQYSDNSHINVLAITPSRDVLASGGYQHIRLYEIASNINCPLINFEGVTRNVTAIGFNSVNNFMYSGGEDYHARIWDLRANGLHCQRKLKLTTPINSMFLHPNQVEIYIADQSGSIWIWNLQADKMQRIVASNDSFIVSLVYDHDCRMMAALDNFGKCYIFCQTNFCPKEIAETKNGEVTASGFLHRRLVFQAHQNLGLKCCFSPDSTLLVTTAADTTVKFWRTSDLSIISSDDTILSEDSHTSMLGKISLNRRKSSLFAREQYLRYRQLWSHNINVGVDIDPAAVELRPHKPPPCYLRRRRLRTCATKTNSHCNGFNASERIQPFRVIQKANQKWVWDVVFSRDSQFLFTASSDHFVRLWSVYTGQMVREYSGHQKAVSCLAFSDMFVDGAGLYSYEG
ncbi:target of rapamycin complex subunit LST8-like protein [Sarcoptes scabiei]|uniref:Target of rapamycin complex subunit lst8 n=1 Tax=Sarcoptes scabiei TaxID=52283 RepID=A0A132AHU3_SARSC|nr:target of rapamycin complex subunit LST8-like protein [Sarcoptes scabiei]